jgi:hypothetical protein
MSKEALDRNGNYVIIPNNMHRGHHRENEYRRNHPYTCTCGCNGEMFFRCGEIRSGHFVLNSGSHIKCQNQSPKTRRDSIYKNNITEALLKTLTTKLNLDIRRNHQISNYKAPDLTILDRNQQPILAINVEKSHITQYDFSQEIHENEKHNVSTLWLMDDRENNHLTQNMATQYLLANADQMLNLLIGFTTRRCIENFPETDNKMYGFDSPTWRNCITDFRDKLALQVIDMAIFNIMHNKPNISLEDAWNSVNFHQNIFFYEDGSRILEIIPENKKICFEHILNLATVRNEYRGHCRRFIQNDACEQIFSRQIHPTNLITQHLNQRVRRQRA